MPSCVGRARCTGDRTNDRQDPRRAGPGVAIEAGADDVMEDDGMIEITGPVDTFKSIADLLHQAKVNPEEAELRMVPKQEMELEVSETLQVMKVIENLEDMDDVQSVYSNLKVSEEALLALETE